MSTIFENNWTGGWNPSADDKSTSDVLSLIRMDNLTFNRQGTLSLARSSSVVANDFNASNVYSIFSSLLNSIQRRFVYIDSGVNKAVMVTDPADISNFNVTLVTQAESSKRMDFLDAIGRVFYISGAIQREYDGTNDIAIGIAAPTAPTLTSNATNTVVLTNLNAGTYSNWTSVFSTTFFNTTDIHGTGIATPSHIANVFSFKTVYSGTVDTTNLGGTGKDTPDDIFSFDFEIDDATQLIWVYVELQTDASNYFHLIF